ncbi:hypothetical protein FHG87_005925 [Trinorchestia longiramus]|nr:hypothetical protein FHG87_005925 [Trinorchestia longiramus]
MSLQCLVLQGHMGGMLRGGSMDQRWQDLASLLSLPSPSDPSTTPPLHPPPPPPPPTTSSSTGMTTHHHHHHHHHHPPPSHHHHHHQPPPPPHLAPHHNVPHQQPPPTIHHPHALYPAHEGVGGGSVPRGGLLHNATLPPALPDPVSHNITYANSMGASSHLGASGSSGNNPVSEHLPDHHHPHPHHQHHQYKMETSSPSSSLIGAAPPPAPPSHPHDMLYYQFEVTKKIPSLRNLSYERRLQHIELISREQRILREQLIETYEHLNGFNDVTLEGLFDRR